jgi:hypothetical protein
MRLDAAVYQSIQVYGMSFLERGGVQIMLVLIAVSVFLAARMKPLRDPLTAEGPHAPVNRTPQTIFLAVLIACVLYVIYDISDLAFLGKVFPMAVALITLALLLAIAVLTRRNRPNYAYFDSEREWVGEDKPLRGDLYYQSWILGLLAAVAVLGFIMGIFVYIVTFLRVKGGARWHWAIVGGLGAVGLLSVFGHFLVLDYPKGLLQNFFELPWPID